MGISLQWVVIVAYVRVAEHVFMIVSRQPSLARPRHDRLLANDMVKEKQRHDLPRSEKPPVGAEAPLSLGLRCISAGTSSARFRMGLQKGVLLVRTA